MAIDVDLVSLRRFWDFGELRFVLKLDWSVGVPDLG